MFGQSFVFGSIVVPAVPEPLSVDYLLVAGGGGASGSGQAGGAGAGGLRTSYSNTSTLNGHTESSLLLSTLVDYNVTIGAGGAGAVNNATTVGSNSKFGIIGSEITSTGGGCGLSAYEWNNSRHDGGSGGGATPVSPNQTAFGLAVTTPVTQGYNGSPNGPASPPPGAGGGGANETGQYGSSGYRTSTAGRGGNGLIVSILNESNATTANVGQVSSGNVYYAGGGGGGGRYVTEGIQNGGAGGLGGGAGGGRTQYRTSTPRWIFSQNGGSGRVNSGGGAGGGGYADAASGGNRTGGNGGSGVLVVRYPSQFNINETTSNLLTFQTFTEGSDKVTVFTGGEGTIQFS